MIQLLLGVAFPVVGLALAAGYAGTDLVTGPSGPSMIVSGGDRVNLAPARFDEGDVCASKLLYGETANGNEPAKIRFVAMSLGADGRDVELGVREVPAPAGSAGETVLLLFDRSGQFVAMSKPPELQPAAAAAGGGCVKMPKPSEQKPV